ncbi:MAG: hypothetical protein KDK71_02755 [Chlamydiia bacterium]|nr:hypothetical protein [Chlamydiia bacterium]
MSVSGVSSEESYGFSYQGVEESQEETKAPVPQGVSGEGIGKLRAEEHYVQADILEKEKQVSRMKKLALEDCYFPYDEDNFVLLDKIAALDIAAAKEIIESWNYASDKGRGYAILSKHLSDEDAAEMLSFARKGCWNISGLIMIYEEEKRRDLFQAKETLWAIFNKLESHQPGYNWRETFPPVAFAFKYDLSEKDKLLEDLCQNLRSNTLCIFSFSIKEWLHAIKEWPLELQKTLLDVYKERAMVCAMNWRLKPWGQILAFELSQPQLVEEGKKDVSKGIAFLENSNLEERSYYAGVLIKLVSPHAPYEAEKFLPFLDQEKKDEIALAKLRIFIGKCKDPSFDKVKGFDLIEKEVAPLLAPGDSKGHQALFQAAFCAKGKEGARPYFHHALQAVRKEDSLHKTEKVARKMRKDISAHWSAFWGISEEEEGAAVDPLKGTIFQGFSEWDLLSLAKALKNTNLSEEKKQVLDGLYRLYEENPDSYFGRRILKAELALL